MEQQEIKKRTTKESLVFLVIGLLIGTVTALAGASWWVTVAVVIVSALVVAGIGTFVRGR